MVTSGSIKAIHRLTLAKSFPGRKKVATMGSIAWAMKLWHEMGYEAMPNTFFLISAASCIISSESPSLHTPDNALILHDSLRLHHHSMFIRDRSILRTFQMSFHVFLTSSLWSIPLINSKDCSRLSTSSLCAAVSSCMPLPTISWWGWWSTSIESSDVCSGWFFPKELPTAGYSYWLEVTNNKWWPLVDEKRVRVLRWRVKCHSGVLRVKNEGPVCV